MAHAAPGTPAADQPGERPPQLGDLLAIDAALGPVADSLCRRYATYARRRRDIEAAEGSLAQFALAYRSFGLQPCGGGIVYREWAPGARSLRLCGDFNGWNRSQHRATRDAYGVWELFLPDLPDGSPAIAHGSRVKVASARRRRVRRSAAGTMAHHGVA